MRYQHCSCLAGRYAALVCICDWLAENEPPGVPASGSQGCFSLRRQNNVGSLLNHPRPPCSPFYRSRPLFIILPLRIIASLFQRSRVHSFPTVSFIAQQSPCATIDYLQGAFTAFVTFRPAAVVQHYTHATNKTACIPDTDSDPDITLFNH